MCLPTYPSCMVHRKSSSYCPSVNLELGDELLPEGIAPNFEACKKQYPIFYSPYKWHCTFPNNMAFM